MTEASRVRAVAGAAWRMIEGVLTVIFSTTDERSRAAVASLSIGLALILIQLVSIPIDNTSVNSARSARPALLVGRLSFAQPDEDRTLAEGDVA